MIATIVILGASGDLTSRVLMPALMRLHEAGQLLAGFRIVGLARDDWDSAKFRRYLESNIPPSGESGSPLWPREMRLLRVRNIARST